MREAEAALDLVVRNSLPDLQDIRVHVLDVIQITEDEGLLDVEAACNDIASVGECKAVALLQLKVLREQCTGQEKKR